MGKNYIPSNAWVSKVSKDGNVASEVFMYLDDVWLLGWCDRECWNATKLFDSKCNYLGIQDAPRKSKEPYQIQGSWVGSIIHKSYGLEGILSREKWDKMKGILRELAENLSNAGKLRIKDLLSQWGLLVYCARKYIVLKPHLNW